MIMPSLCGGDREKSGTMIYSVPELFTYQRLFILYVVPLSAAQVHLPVKQAALT